MDLHKIILERLVLGTLKALRAAAASTETDIDDLAVEQIAAKLVECGVIKGDDVPQPEGGGDGGP